MAEIARFCGRVFTLDINPCVDVPKRVVHALRQQTSKRTGPIAVTGTVNTFPVRSTVVRFRGKWRLYLNTEMRRGGGIDVGDTAVVSLAFDPEPRVLRVPAALRTALRQNRQAAHEWAALVPSRRREIVAYLTSLKTRASLERNVTKLLARLGRTEAT